MLDADLAAFYCVLTGRVNEAVKRNIERFPEDSVFQLTLDEAQDFVSLRSQIAILKMDKCVARAPS